MTDPSPRTMPPGGIAIADRRASAVGLALPPLIFTFIVYAPISGNYFTGDDFTNLYRLATFDLLEYLVTPNGGHLYVARNAMFALMRACFGVHAEYYFWCVLLTHLLNVWLLFRVIALCTDSARLASWSAALWGVSPLHEMTLGYYSAFAHAMVATPLLAILLSALRSALQKSTPSRRQRAWWYGLALIAATSFGTGIALAAVLPVALYLFLPQRTRGWRAVPLATLMVVIPVLYATLPRVYERISGFAPLGQPDPHVVLAYAPYIVMATMRLAAFGLEHLLLGFWNPPWSSIWLGYAALACLVTATVYVAQEQPGLVRRQLSALCLLLWSGYLAVAIGRGGESYMAGEEGFWRVSYYHYTGTILFTIILSVVTSRVAQRVVGSERWLGAAFLAGWYGLTLTAFLTVGFSINHHDASRARTARMLAALRNQIRSLPEGQPLYIRNRVFPPVPNFVISSTMFPGLAAAFCIFFPSNVVDGHRVYFLERNPAVHFMTLRGARIRNLLLRKVPPGSPVVELVY